MTLDYETISELGFGYSWGEPTCVQSLPYGSTQISSKYVEIKPRKPGQTIEQRRAAKAAWNRAAYVRRDVAARREREKLQMRARRERQRAAEGAAYTERESAARAARRKRAQAA